MRHCKTDTDGIIFCSTPTILEDGTIIIIIIPFLPSEKIPEGG